LIDSTNNSNNARYATGGDLDGDGLGEIIYVAGGGYNTEADPTLTVGVYVWEYDGNGDDHYGVYPAAVGNFQDIQGIGPSAVHAQQIRAMDIDGDGIQEVIFAANGGNDFDYFYVMSTPDDLETDGAGSGFVTWNVELAVNPRSNTAIFGGGSPMDVVPAALNGDGLMDLSFHSWNNFNFFNGVVTSADTYVIPDETTQNPFLQAAAEDHTGLFGGHAVDIDGDGTVEVFYPNFNTSNLAVLSYAQDQDVLSITPAELVIDVVEGTGWGGITHGDVDGDGALELWIGGSGLSPSAYNNGEPSRFLNLVEYLGGDPTESTSWELHKLDTGNDLDTTGFNVVYRDSMGVMTKYFEDAYSRQGVIDTTGNAADPIFPTGVVNLGDADGDGRVEVAISFQ